MDDAEKEALQRIVQLVVLCIPLFTLPLILKSSNSLLGKIANNADRVTKAIGVEKGLTAAQGGMKKRAGNYARVGGVTGARYAGKSYGALRRTNRWQKMPIVGGDPDKASTLGRVAQSVSGGVRKMRATDRAVNAAVEARKAGKNEAINEAMYGILKNSGDNLGKSALKGGALSNLANYGGAQLVAQAGAQQEKAEKERVSGIYARFKIDNTSVGELSQALKDAIASGDHSTATAAINRLTEMGTGGVESVGQTLYSAGKVEAPMQETIMKAINDGANYGALVGKDAGTVKSSGFDATTGQFTRKAGADGGLAPLSAEQLAGQSLNSLSHNYDTISQAAAQEIIRNNGLRAKISSPEALALIQAKATGQARPTDSAYDKQINNADPTKRTYTR